MFVKRPWVCERRYRSVNYYYYYLHSVNLNLVIQKYKYSLWSETSGSRLPGLLASGAHAGVNVRCTVFIFIVIATYTASVRRAW